MSSEKKKKENATNGCTGGVTWISTKADGVAVAGKYNLLQTMARIGKITEQLK